MSEPFTAGSAAGVAGWKLLGGAAGAGAIGAGLASIVVMSITPPRSPREWAVGLTSTVVGSIAGGSAVIMKFGLQSWAHDPFGLVAMLGLVFACGLPAWAIVRWVFNWIEKRKDKELPEIVAELADDARKIAAGGQNG